MQIGVESGLLAVLCLVDGVFTLWLIGTGQATEANPILYFYLQRGGMISFAGIKMLFSLGPLFGLELIRLQSPRFVQAVLRVGIAFYLLLYGIGVWRVNSAHQTLPRMHYLSWGPPSGS